MYFFVACAGLVAFAFRREAFSERSGWTWRSSVLLTAAALVSAWAVFAALCLTLPPPHNVVAASLGLLLLVPCLCIVPYLVSITRQPFAAAVFAITLVTCVKLAGCVIVVAVYGWNAGELGHTSMPWTRPNLLVWSFWIGTGILSATFYFLGARRWQYTRALGN
jgi:hypothetical protein